MEHEKRWVGVQSLHRASLVGLRRVPRSEYHAVACEPAARNHEYFGELSRDDQTLRRRRASIQIRDEWHQRARDPARWSKIVAMVTAEQRGHFAGVLAGSGESTSNVSVVEQSGKIDDAADGRDRNG